MNAAGVLSPISLISHALHRELERRAAEQGLTGSQFQVLRRLKEVAGLSGAALSRDLNISAASICHLLDHLEARGLVCRQRCSQNRRSVPVFLTPQGEALVQPLLEILVQIHEQALTGLDPEERAQLARALQQVAANMGLQERELPRSKAGSTVEPKVAVAQNASSATTEAAFGIPACLRASVARNGP